MGKGVWLERCLIKNGWCLLDPYMGKGAWLKWQLMGEWAGFK